MSVLIPTDLAIISVVHPSAVSGASYCDVRIGWTPGSRYIYAETAYSSNGGTTWVTSGPFVGSARSYSWSGCALNTTIAFKVRGYGDGAWSPYTDPLTTAVYADTEAETVSMTEAWAEGGSQSGGGPTAASDTEAETVTMTDTYIDAVISKTNIAYFIGSQTGNVYKYNATYHGDNGTTIPCRWESKEIDFTDAYPQYDGMWKCVDRIWLRYIDKDVVTVSVSLSVDNGSTWTTVSRSLGTGTGYIKETSFDFRKTGRFFKIRVEETSSDKDFQWTDMYLEGYPCGDYFSLT